jgi:hypothetical protein
MAWDTEYERFGVVKIEGNKVMIYKDQFHYTTVFASKQVTNAKWVDGNLIITMIDGKVRRYNDSFTFTII